ncbi:MAG: hypothetical protein FJ241_11010 [Nitrospira sp.]|nr:hypothetical protein [Nitrospira sp.]
MATFGNTTTGSVSTCTGKRIYATSYNLTEKGLITSLGIRIGGNICYYNPPVDFWLAIYDNKIIGGYDYVNVLKGYTNTQTSVLFNTTYNLDLITPVILDSGLYWLAVHSPTDPAGVPLRYDDGSSINEWSATAFYTIPPDPFVVYSGGGGKNICIYATYTPIFKQGEQIFYQ